MARENPWNRRVHSANGSAIERSGRNDSGQRQHQGDDRCTEQDRQADPFRRLAHRERLALRAQAKVREEMDQRFTLRRLDVIKGSVRVELGNDSDPKASVSIPPRSRSG